MTNALLRVREAWCLENGTPTVLRAQVRAVQSRTKTGAQALKRKCTRGEQERCRWRALVSQDLQEAAGRRFLHRNMQD
jgi:hypothetical protein